MYFKIVRRTLKYESEVAQSCPTLCDPMDCRLPGFYVHGIFQARILEWVAVSFSRRSSRPRDWTQVSRIVGRRFTVWSTREYFPESGSFPMSQFFSSVLPMNIQGWFPLGLTDLISLQPKDFKESSPVPQFKSINSSVLSLLHDLHFIPTCDHWKNHRFDYTDLCQQSVLFAF